MKIFITLATLLLGTVSATSASAKCLDNELVEKVTAPFKITRWNGKEMSKPLNLKNICNKDDSTYKLIEALIFAEQIQSLADGPSPDSQNLVAKTGPFNFFKARIKNIIIEEAPMPYSSCAIEGVAALVQTNEYNTTHICTATFNKYSAMTTSSFLIHEARHVEGYDHAYCNHGSFKNRDRSSGGACDRNYATQGSYGIEAGYKIHIMNVAKDPVIKQQARAEAVGYLLNRFNELPWDLKPGILAQSQKQGLFKRKESQALTFFDGQKTLSLKNLANIPADAVMTSRAGLPIFYTNNGQVKSYIYDHQLADTPGTMAEDYRLKSTPAERNELLDVYYGDGFACRLYQQNIVCESSNNDGKVFSLKMALNSITPFSIVAVPGKTPADLRVYLLDENGERFQLPSNIEELKRFNENKILKVNGTNGRMLGLALTDSNQVYALNTEKKLMRQTETRWELVPQLKGHVVEKIIPFTWSKKLEEF